MEKEFGGSVKWSGVLSCGVTEGFHGNFRKGGQWRFKVYEGVLKAFKAYQGVSVPFS